MTLWGLSARETAAVTSVEFKMTEQPRTSLPTGHTNGMVPQPRLHWRRLLSTLMEGGALRRGMRQGERHFQEAFGSYEHIF